MVPPRNHESFAWLRDMKELDKHVNESIKLPRLGSELPKELRPLGDGFVPSILLTEQRVEIIKRFYNMMSISKDNMRNIGDGGLILSGPNGAGKSIMSYLLACTAYANNCILVYIVCMMIFLQFELTANC